MPGSPGAGGRPVDDSRRHAGAERAGAGRAAADLRDRRGGRRRASSGTRFRCRPTRAWQPRFGDDRSSDSPASATALQPGDAILIVGAGARSTIRAASAGTSASSATVSRPTRRAAHARSRWATRPRQRQPAVSSPRAPARRSTCSASAPALFGHNAPDPRLMSPTTRQLGALTDGIGREHRPGAPPCSASRASTIDLDAAYPQDRRRAAGSRWSPTTTTAHPVGLLRGYVELYRGEGRSAYPSRTRFRAVAARSRASSPTPTRISTCFRYRLRETLVLAQTEAAGRRRDAARRTRSTAARWRSARIVDGLAAGPRARAQRQARARAAAPGSARRDAGARRRAAASAIEEGDSLRLLAAPEEQSGALLAASLTRRAASAASRRPPARTQLRLRAARPRRARRAR